MFEAMHHIKSTMSLSVIVEDATLLLSKSKLYYAKARSKIDLGLKTKKFKKSMSKIALRICLK